VIGRRLCLALLAAAFAFPSCAPIVNRDTSIRVLVYNIHAGKDAECRDNLADVAALIETTGADVVLLQEVDRGTARSGGVDQLQVLMDATEYDGVFGRSLDYDGGAYGIAALSKEGFTFDFTSPLPVEPQQTRAGGSHEPRVVLTAVAQTSRGRLQTFSTHLDASATDEYRLQEAAQLLLRVRTRMSPQTPVVVGGDFNAEPVSATIARMRDAGLRDAWTECGQGDGFTFPASAPVKRIDYLFLSEGLRCSAAQVIDSQASDHRPLLVTLEGVGWP
jgi:endonuclease/exonuclease/phosphatase family metal-dependent hydrolase